ncbi:CD99 molecule isoform X2 [Ctenopharyngodon idella]|uniref:CD99 molecule isoform X2 n=1 Tax=Ctenopharyngodon idella TaxID=7959 RepID=UPI00222EAAEE|nr:CD99 molecule isoform X2 [Ctenopharyngodon idella]
MTSYTWILLILASLAATRAQDLDLSDALFDDDDDKPPAKATVKPAPPKNSNPDFDLSDAFDLDPKKPAVVPPKPGDDKKKPSGDEFDLSDAFGPDEEPKKPVVPPKERGAGGGTFDDKDLSDVNEDGYVPDKGRIGGGGADPGYDDQSGGASEQPQDLNQKWLQLIKMLGVKIPEGLSVWIDQFLQTVEPLLEQFRGLLNVTEEKAEL